MSYHIAVTQYVVKYLKNCKHIEVGFSAAGSSKLSVYLNFPINSIIPTFLDANWGPQDATVPTLQSSPETLDLFKPRSTSGFVLWLNSPAHWTSKQQYITIYCSTEAEIYTADNCIKVIQHVFYVLKISLSKKPSWVTPPRYTMAIKHASNGATACPQEASTTSKWVKMQCAKQCSPA
eukprot:15351708-Ditylum_brightwellii.AAC.1